MQTFMCIKRYISQFNKYGDVKEMCIYVGIRGACVWILFSVGERTYVFTLSVNEVGPYS